MANDQTWEQFSQRKSFVREGGFFGCLDRDGVWFDSADTLAIAVHWCCMDQGVRGLSPNEEMEWMADTGRKLGLSIVHSDMLKKMWERGLIS